VNNQYTKVGMVQPIVPGPSVSSKGEESWSLTQDFELSRKAHLHRALLVTIYYQANL
jgi:hypothetical protein